MEKDLSSSTQSASDLPDRYAPRLLIQTEPAHRVFFGNLMDSFSTRRLPLPDKFAEGAAFWTDVFISSDLPWFRFLESLALHLLAIVGLWGAARAGLLRPQALPGPVFSKREVIYFPASEYLPPLDTGHKTAHQPQRGDPEFSKQTILSVPPEADNRTQTVVTPPDIRLKNEIRLPNVVAWNSVSPAAPITALSRLQLPAQPPGSVVAPPPEIPIASRHMVVAPQTAVIEPPPTIQEQIRK